MYILTIHYPNSDGATFDFDYFHEQHLPKVGIHCIKRDKRFVWIGVRNFIRYR